MASLSDFLREWQSDSQYVEAHTSGSTGQPKCIRLLKQDMQVSANATNSFFNITSESTLACPLSFDYIAGKMMAVRAEQAHCKLLALPVSNNISVDCHIDLLSAVPSQVASLLSQSNAPAKIRNLLLGGAPVSEKLRQEIVKAGFNAWIGYGMTETCSHVALRRLDDDLGIYNAMPGVEFDKDNRGCLVIKSSKFSWGRLITNDVVELIGPTSFRWVGRADNAIISGGVKVHPEEVELKISGKIADIPPFYIIGEDNDKWGQQVVMVVAAPLVCAKALIDELRKIDLQPAQRPKALLCVEKLPHTPNGNKIARIIPKEFIRIC